MATMEENMELDLRDYLRILHKRWLLISVIVCFATIAAGLLSVFVMKPVYEASTKIIVNGSSEQLGLTRLDLNSVNLDLRLIETYKEIIKTGAIMGKVAEEHPEFELSANQLIHLVQIRTVNNSQVMTLSVKHRDHRAAVDIVNAVSETFQREIPKIMTVDNVSILDRAEYMANPKPVSPNIPLNVAIGFIVSLLFAVGLVFLLEYLDDTLKTEQDVKQVLGLPVLAEITKIPEEQLIVKTEVQPLKKAEGARNSVSISDKAANHRY